MHICYELTHSKATSVSLTEAVDVIRAAVHYTPI